jgi:DNA uptake protein ComE-like DNA-binding protein
MPFRQVESFRFNPNTVSVEDLCRLGFSPKQAESIDNYRRKGGRFRRKADFAKSYVVSDSIYRRLESFIDIPLVDLNTADSAAFDALPGIGGWFASKMLEYREKLGAYSYKEQLLDIYKFTEEKYQALEDLITVSPKYMTPYPLWTLPADSLRLHPYIKDYETARSIVLYRENSDKEDMTVEGLLKSWILTPDSADRLSRCKIRSP